MRSHVQVDTLACAAIPQDSELDFQNTSVVIRSGHPGMLNDLRRVAAGQAGPAACEHARERAETALGSRVLQHAMRRQHRKRRMPRLTDSTLAARALHASHDCVRQSRETSCARDDHVDFAAHNRQTRDPFGSSPSLAVVFVPAQARCCIVLAEDEVNADTADARVVRVVLALQTLDTLDSLAGHVVAEVCQMHNKNLVEIVGGPMVETVVTEDILGRLMISCTRQPGLRLRAPRSARSPTAAPRAPFPCPDHVTD